MSIHFITGKPGGGKGLVAMEEIVKELVNGERPIITNLPVQIEPWIRCIRRGGKTKRKPEIGLRNYLIQTHGSDFNVKERVFLLDDETQTKEFYLWRKNGHGLACAQWTHKQGQDGKVKLDAFDTELASKGGVFYVIDECWKFFNARDWQNTGPGVLFYSAQHRKLGDTLLLVTQHSKQVESQMRMVAQDFWVVRNHSKLKLGPFRQPSMFMVSTFESLPTGGNTQEPMSRRVFRLDKEGLGACYDTAAGVGLQGGAGADIGEKAKGLPFWMIGLLIIAVGLGLVGLARSAGWGTGKLLTGGFQKAKQSTNTLAKAGEGMFPGLAQALTPKLGAPVERPRGYDVVTNEPASHREMTGYYSTNTIWGEPFWTVCLSDGSTYRTRDGHLNYVTPNYCIVDGQVCPFRNGRGPIAISPSVQQTVQTPTWNKPTKREPRKVNITNHETNRPIAPY